MKKRIICWILIIGGLGLLSARLPLDDLDVVIGPEQSICFNNQPDTIFSIITGGTGDYDFSWEQTLDTTTAWTNIQGEDTSFYRPAELQKTTFYRLIVKDEGNNKEDTSNFLKIHVFEEILLDTISGGTSPVCYEGDAGWLEAIFTGGSDDQRVVWYDQDDDSLGQGDKYHVIGLTSATTFHFVLKDEQCGDSRSNDKLIEVLPQVNAGLIAGSPLNKICYGDDPGILTAQPSGGQGDFTIEWKKGDGTTIFTNYDPPWEYDVPALMTTTQYYYIVHDPCGTDESEKVTIDVYPLLEAGAITGVPSTVCYGDDPGNITAHPQGGSGEWIEYQWYNDDEELLASGPGNSYHIGSITSSTGYYYIVKDASCGTDQSPVLSITVHPELKALDISGTETSICTNSNGGTLTAEGTGGSNQLSYKWYRWNNQVGEFLGNGKEYEVGILTQTSSYCYIVTDAVCGAATSAPYTIQVQDIFTPSLTISGPSTAICENDPVLFTANPDPVFSGEMTYQWKMNGSVVSTSQTYTTSDLEPGNSVTVQVTYADGTCVEPKVISESTSVEVNPLPDDARQVVGKPFTAPVVLIYPGDTTNSAYGTVFSYIWLADGTPINPPENKKFYYNPHLDESVTYSVRVLNEYGCDIELFFDWSKVKSLPFDENDIFMIFPNPNNGEFEISFNDEAIPSGVHTFTLKVLDLSGKTVFKKELPLTAQPVALDGMIKGVYMVDVSIEGGYRQIRKVLIF